MLAAALFAMAVTGHASSHRAARDSLPPVSVILEIRIGTVAAATALALRSGDRALLQTAIVLRLAGFRPDSGVAAYLSTDSLSTLLRTPITIDWDDLVVTISDNGSLPVSRRVAREQRRELFNATVTTPSASRVTTIAVPMLPQSLIADYNVSTSLGIARPDARLSLGSSVLGGGLDADFIGLTQRQLRPSNISWERDWPGQSRVRHLRVGSVSPRRGTRIGMGVFMSSELPARADSLEFIELAGVLSNGWELEAYRDDVLIYTGLTDSIGAYAVTVPVYHGINRLAVTAYGPLDEQRTIARYVSIDGEMLRAGTTVYDATIGRCETARCAYGAELRTRYAPIARITAGTSLGVFLSSSGPALVPSGLLAARLRDDINVSAHYSRDDATGDIRFAPSPDLDIVAGYRRTVADQSPSGVSTQARRSSLFVNSIWRPDADRVLSAIVDFHDHDGLPQRRLRIASSLSQGSAFIRPFASIVQHGGTGPAEFEVGLTADAPVPFWLPAASRIRAGVGDAHSSSNFVKLAIPFARIVQVQTGAEWLERVRMPRLTVSVGILSRSVRYDGRSVTQEANFSTTHALSGSIMFNRDSHADDPHIAFSSNASRGRAEIRGRLFIDANADGVFDARDQPLQGVSILVGTTVVETDSVGRYRLGDLTPFTSIIVSADSLTLPSPNLSVRSLRVVPLPNGVTRVDLPVTLGASGGPVRRVGRFPQDPQRGDTPPIHGDYFEPGVRDSNPVADAWEPTKTREHIAPQR